MSKRGPMELLERYGRQLLIDGHAIEAQQQLAEWAVVPASDDSDVAAHLVEVATMYLVGAGLGRVAADGALAEAISGLDGDAQVSPKLSQPPAVHLYAASREYGVSVDILATRAARSWERGEADDAEVATLIFNLGDAAQAHHAVEFGASVAEVVLNALVGLEPLPAVLHTAWDDSQPEPRVTRMEAVHAQSDAPDALAPAGLLAELRQSAEVLQVIHQDCEQQYPNEACGLLLRAGDGSLQAMPCKNMQDRYHELDPETYPRTSRAAFKLNERKIMRVQEEGLELTAIYHSHCEAGAYFSAEDIRSAAPEGEPLYPGVGNLVVSVLAGHVRAEAMFHFSAAHGTFLREADAS